MHGLFQAKLDMFRFSHALFVVAIFRNIFYIHSEHRFNQGMNDVNRGLQFAFLKTKIN